MLGEVCHDIKDRMNEISRYIGMKQIAHRIDEDTAGPFPKVRIAKFVRMDSDPKSRTARLVVAIPLVPWVAHRLQPFCENERVTVFASGGNSVAARGWIPRCVRPFNGTIETHWQYVNEDQ